jgi:hypothetical protein
MSSLQAHEHHSGVHEASSEVRSVQSGHRTSQPRVVYCDVDSPAQELAFGPAVTAGAKNMHARQKRHGSNLPRTNLNCDAVLRHESNAWFVGLPHNGIAPISLETNGVYQLDMQLTVEAASSETSVEVSLFAT